jgi:hypothetical protein
MLAGGGAEGILRAHSGRTPCRGPVRVLCGGCAGFPRRKVAPGSQRRCGTGVRSLRIVWTVAWL